MRWKERADSCQRYSTRTPWNAYMCEYTNRHEINIFLSQHKLKNCQTGKTRNALTGWFTRIPLGPSPYLVEKQLWFCGKQKATLQAREFQEWMDQSDLVGLISKSLQSGCSRVADGATEGRGRGIFSCWHCRLHWCAHHLLALTYGCQWRVSSLWLVKYILNEYKAKVFTKPKIMCNKIVLIFSF